jgi:hypothetical protein
MCKNCQQPATTETETAASAAIVPHRLPVAADPEIRELATTRPWELPLHRVGGENADGSPAKFLEHWREYLLARNLQPAQYDSLGSALCRLLMWRMRDIASGDSAIDYKTTAYLEHNGCGRVVEIALPGKPKPVKAMFQTLRGFGEAIELPALGRPTDGERARFGNAVDLLSPQKTHYYAIGVRSNAVFWRGCDFGQQNSCWWSRDGYLDAWGALEDAGALLFFDGREVDFAISNLGLTLADVANWGAQKLWQKFDQDCDCGRVWCALADCGELVFFNQYLPPSLSLPALLGQYNLETASRNAELRCALYINSDQCRTWSPRSSFELSTELGGLRRCCCCESLLGEDAAYSDGDSDYCEDCFFERFGSCEHCGEYTPADDMVSINGGGQYYCQYCADNHANCCERCGEYSTGNNTVTVDGDCWCQDCAESENVCCCSSCGEYVTAFSLVSTDGDKEYWCSDCADGLPECFDCDCLVHGKHAVLAGDGATVPDQLLCHDCADSYSECACGRLDYPSTIDDGGCCDVCAAALASVERAAADMVAEGAPCSCC